jgi:shikimate dehydrogenase
MKTLRLGLIGGNITESRSPALQIVCGLSVGRNVTYDLLIPAEQGLTFADVLKRCEAAGFDGVNVTYPYKEEVLKHTIAGSTVVKALGAANTVRFSNGTATAFNTDYTGFISAYRERWSNRPPGRVLLIGSGGVGRAIAFALADLGAEDVLLHDADGAKSNALLSALNAAGFDKVTVIKNLANSGPITGIINATPLGMTGREGSPLTDGFTANPTWSFDAVYTPEDTVFRRQTITLGAEFLSGYELYFHQGIQGFRIFSGTEVTRLDWVREVLRGEHRAFSNHPT